jgi:hypothetical protein
MKKLIIAACIFLSACNPAGQRPDPGVKPVQIPDAPAYLLVPAEKLPPITDNSMGTAQIQGAEDDKRYNAVAWRNNTWIKFYKCIQTTVNTKTDATKCFDEVSEK